MNLDPGMGNSGFGGETQVPRRVLASGDQGLESWAGGSKYTGFKASTQVSRQGLGCQVVELLFFFSQSPSPAFINFCCACCCW